MINSFLTEEGLTPIGAIYVARCEEVRNLAVQYTDEIKLSEIYVFGSLARARPQTNYDVDLMFAIDGDIADVEHTRDVIMCELPKELGATYASDIYQGLEQRFTTLFDKADKAISDKEGKALVSNIRQLVERSQGKEITVMGSFTTLLATARRERAEGIEEGKLAVYAKLMKKFKLQTPEEVDRFLDNEDGEDSKLGSLDLSPNK